MSDDKVTCGRSGGVGFTGLLTIVFVVLKLTGYVGWSWWWVISPLWITTIIWVVIIALFVAIKIWSER